MGQSFKQSGTADGVLRRTVRLLAALRRDTGGNAMALMAAAIVPLLAMIGGGVDMGRSYLAQSRLQQACDAGVLAARKQIGSSIVSAGALPAAAQTVGDQFFNLNFRPGAYGTEGRDFDMTLEADTSVSGVAVASVPTSIMAAFGYDDVDLRVECTARLNFSDADVMMVLDTTGSMVDKNPGDSETRIEALRRVVKEFHAQLESQKGPATRMRYGFLPYAHNVNVGGLLKSDWMVGSWTYQSRLAKPDQYVNGGTQTGWVHVRTDYPGGTAAAITPFNSNNCPASTFSDPRTYTSAETAGPPRSYYVEHTANGNDYYCSFADARYTVSGTRYTNYVRRYTYEWKTYDTGYQTYKYDYKPITYDVSGVKNANGNLPTNLWATIDANTYISDGDPATTSDLSRYWYEGCIEERSTYQISDYANVDFTRALDLNIDLVPDPSDPDTQWRPMFRGITWSRALDWGARGSFSVTPVLDTNNDYMVPDWLFDDADCPTAAAKLAEMDASDVANYVDSLVPAGATYHDIGMIWGGRLISPTGIFASENADRAGRTTSRHLIFLTDGQTAPRDWLYSSYGIEGIDQRRWAPSNPSDTLTETVEARFTVACEEVKKKNVTVWVVGFGTQMTDMLKECAGNGHWFQADDAAQLSAAFQAIATSMGDLRLAK